MHRFDYSFLKDGMLPADMVNLSAAVAAFQAISGERKRENEAVYSELVQRARMDSVKGSNAIEGIVTSEERMTAIVNRKAKPAGHAEKEIAGYRDALDLIHKSWQELDFDEELICHLHELLMAYTKDPSAGHYKDTNNLILSVDEEGRREVRFKPVSAAETKEAMEQLVLAYIDARATSGINRLLLIPCVILDFLCIHPFMDGNGRVSRLLTLLLLYQAGIDIGQYVSVEGQINERKDLYYEALKNSSDGWHENENSYFPFMTNFLSTLYRCYKEMDQRFSASNGKKLTKKERVEQMVLKNILPISKAEIAERLPEVSVTTIEAVLGKMVREGRVLKIGTGRSTQYVNASRIIKK